MNANNFQLQNLDQQEEPNSFLFNRQCYRFEIMHFNDGIFDNCVDATYVITMEGSDRLPKILNELDKYRPTSLVYILHNKGYKKCPKVLHRQLSVEDLVDANFQIFFHAYNNQYNNILILEDDCFFSERLLDPKVINDVSEFVYNNKDVEFAYGLGLEPWLTVPTLQNHYQCILFGSSHAFIFSKSMRERYLFDYTQKAITSHWDIELMYKNWNKGTLYTYKYPLAFQPFEDTENSKNWSVDVPKMLQPLSNFIIQFIKKIFNAKQDPKQALETLYFYAKIWSFIIFVLLFIFIIWLMNIVITKLVSIQMSNKSTNKKQFTKSK